MAGRKRKPTHLHIVQGTKRPCRINKAEPDVPNEPPRAAVELESRVSFWYGIVVGRIQSVGVGSSADSEQVMLLANRLAEVEACDADIKKFGRVFENIDPKTGSISIKANPAVAQRSEAMRHSQSLLAEFGLSPASRGKVSANEKKKQPVNPWQEIANS